MDTFSIILSNKKYRRHDYLRISVTDRCNLKCVYCMPHQGMDFKPNHEILSFDEIGDFLRLTIDHPFQIRFYRIHAHWT